MSAGRLSEKGRRPSHETVEELGAGHGVEVPPNRTVVLARGKPLGEALVTASLRFGHALDRAFERKVEPSRALVSENSTMGASDVQRRIEVEAPRGQSIPPSGVILRRPSRVCGTPSSCLRNTRRL